MCLYAEGSQNDQYVEECAMNNFAQQKSRGKDYDGPTGRDRDVQKEYATWFSKGFRWNLFGTLTFSHDLTSQYANEVLDRYLRRIEIEARAPLSCLIVEETKSPGLGGAPGRIHFHLLIGCAKTLDPVSLEEVWREDCFGGERTAGPSAKVDRLRTGVSPALYMMKGLFDSGCDWRLWRPQHASKRKPASAATSTETRRMRRRQQARDQRLAAQAA